MTTNYYTLRALVAEWKDLLPGAVVGDVFSQHSGELALAYGSDREEGMIRLSTLAPDHFIFRVDGYSKPRRNVAALMPHVVGREILDVRIAPRDRVIYIGLKGTLAIQIMLFGPRANVLVVDDGATIVDAFRQASALVNTEAPPARPSPQVENLESFLARWRADRKSVAHALSSALPLFDSLLSREAAFRAGVDADQRPDLASAALTRLFDAAQSVAIEAENPDARIYWRDRTPEAFSIVPLTHLDGMREEVFVTVDEGVRTFVRRRLATKHFSKAYVPLEKSLSSAADHYRSTLERMIEELSSPSRADRYEKWGHLLMAGAGHLNLEADTVEVDDLFDGGRTTIPVDPTLSPIDNAQRYYEKARRTRRAREEAEKRLLALEVLADEATSLLERLHEIRTLREIEAFRSEYAEALSRVLPDNSGSLERVPFRRFALPEGYEVWVGRNARQNDDLTFHHAQKHDLWMHARGVPGSHAILRVPNRSARPGRHILEAAAAIAAHFSKARGSSLVPVVVTPRKYVRKVRGGEPGAVIVEREEVILTEPKLPDQNF